MQEQDNTTREVAIEAWNLFFGRAVFTYFELPASWITGYQMEDPLVTNRFLYRNLVWVGTGETECLISSTRNDEKHPNLDFRLKISVDLQKGDPIAPIPETLQSLHEKKGREVVDKGTLESGGHMGSYVLWKEYRPRFRVFGTPQLAACLEGYIPCDITGRLLKFFWKSPSPEMVLEHSDKLIASLNSVLCHGHQSESSKCNLT